MTNGPSSNSGFGRKIAYVCAGIFGLLIALFFLAPTLLSTGWGKQIVIDKVGRNLGGVMTIETLSLNWFGTQTIEGIKVRDEKNQPVLNCPLVKVNQTLWKIVFSRDMGEWTIGSFEYTLRDSLPQMAHMHVKTLDRAGLLPQVQLSVTPLQQGLKGLSGKLDVKNGKVVVLSPNVDPITFNEIALTASLPKDQDQLEIQFNCKTEQSRVQGNVKLTATLRNLNAEMPSVIAQAVMVQLPVRGIDQIVSQFYAPLDGQLLNMIGPTIDMNLNLKTATDVFQLNLDANSPQFSENLSSEASDGIVSLKNPGLIKLTMPPSSFAKFSQMLPTLKGIVLTQPTTFILNVSALSMPMPKKWDDLKAMKIEAALTSTPASNWVFNGQSFSVQNFQMAISTPKLEGGLNTSGQLTAIAASKTAQISYQAQLYNFLSGAPTGKGTLQVQQLPLDLAGQLAGFPLADYLGPTLNASLNFDLSDTSRTLQLAVNTALLQIPKMNFSLAKGLALTEPAQVTYLLTSNVFPKESMQVKENTPLQCTIQQCTLPSFNALDKLQLQVSTQIDQLTFSQFYGPNPYTIQKIAARLGIQTFNQITAAINSDFLNASIEGSLDPQKAVLTLKKPLLIEATINNPLYQAWVSTQAILTQPAKVSLSVDPFSLPLNAGQLKILKIKGLLQIPLLALASNDRSKMITLAKTQAPFQLDAKGKTASFQCTSQIQTQEGSGGAVNLSATVSNMLFEPAFDLSQASVQANGNLANIPSTLLDTFMNNPNISALVGSTFNCTFKGQSSPAQQTFNIQAASPLVNINAAFAVDGTSLQLQGNQGQVTWTLNPDGYKLLDRYLSGQTKGQSPFVLKEPTTFNLTFSNLYFPVQKNGSRIPSLAADISKLRFVVSGKNNVLSFFDNSSKESIQLLNSAFSINKAQNAGPIAFNLSSAVSSQTASAVKSGTGKSGSLNCSGSIDKMLNDQGQVDLTQLTGKIDLSAAQFPARALDIIARAQGKTNLPFSTIFGETINADFSTQLSQLTGPVSLSLNSPNSRASLKGKLIKGALVLDQTLHAQGTITAEISRLILKEVNPLSISYIYSLDPVTLEIPSADFYLPLYPFDVSRMNVPKAKIELGQIYCRNEGNIQATLGLLKNKQFTKDKEVKLWFAPIDLKVKKGIVDVERTEILIASTFDIAIWGNVDMVKDYVDMLLGLPAPTLQKAFGIKGLPDDYVLTIPMKGPSDNVQINTGKATAKVAMLLAWQQKALQGAVGGGPAGAIVGEFIGKLATLPDKDAKVPPAKHPFPWESGKGSSKKATSQSEGKKRHFKKNEKPLKQILKVIR